MLFVPACFPHPLLIREVSGKHITAVDDMSAEHGYNDPSDVIASTSLFYQHSWGFNAFYFPQSAPPFFG